MKVIHGRWVSIACFVSFVPVMAAEKVVTFHRDVTPILYKHCAECHRGGEIAPFPLMSYQDAAKRAEWIVENVTNRRMPPWKAEPGHGDFFGERRMSDEEIATLTAWQKGGAIEGSPSDAPPVPKFATGWGLGEPDVILEAPYDVTVPAEGPDIFHHIVIPLGEAAGREVAAVEFRPGNPRVVHHAVILVDSAGLGRTKDALTPEPGYVTGGGPGVSLSGILTIWAPGVAARRLPSDVAIELPKKGDVIVQLHLHPSGKEEKDRSRVGIYFAKEPAKRHIMSRPFIFGPVTLDIPANEKAHQVEASVKTPVDLWMTAILPHMHYLGKEIRVTAKLPSGEERSMIWIRDWDFNWQDQYVYREPVHLPAGTEVKVVGIYDNSSDNPAQPRTPPARVLFGEETNEEMCLAIFQAIAETPEDSDKVRRALAGNILKQIHDPNVPHDVVDNVVVRLRELGRSELQSELRSRISTLLEPKKQ